MDKWVNEVTSRSILYWQFLIVDIQCSDWIGNRVVNRQISHTWSHMNESQINDPDRSTETHTFMTHWYGTWFIQVWLICEISDELMGRSNCVLDLRIQNEYVMSNVKESHTQLSMRHVTWWILDTKDSHLVWHDIENEIWCDMTQESHTPLSISHVTRCHTKNSQLAWHDFDNVVWCDVTLIMGHGMTWLGSRMPHYQRVMSHNVTRRSHNSVSPIRLSHIPM